MPIDSCGNPTRSPSSRSVRKYGRESSASSDQGGMVIRPSEPQVPTFADRINDGDTISGSAPAFDSSGESFTSIITSSNAPVASRRFASFRGVDGLNHLKQLGCELRLVRLKMSDQVKSGAGHGPSSGALPANSCT